MISDIRTLMPCPLFHTLFPKFKQQQLIVTVLLRVYEPHARLENLMRFSKISLFLLIGTQVL